MARAACPLGLTLYSHPGPFGVFIANIYFYDIDTPLKQFVVAHDNIVRHCRAIHAAVSAA